MHIHHGIEQISHIRYPVVTSGTFDGVHLGHKKILRKIKQIAEEHNGETVLLTFWPHPKYVLNAPSTALKLLTTFDEKAEILQQLGINHLIKIPFTKEFSQTSSRQFVEDIIVSKLGCKELVIGYDHRFGRNREGSFDYLQENAASFGFKVREIPRQDIDHIGISSTKIRGYLLNHQVHLANKLLGRPYSLSGKVAKGQQVGRTIGFPTANIEIKESYKLVPSDGAYAVQVSVNGSKLRGMMNIGLRPTVEGVHKTIEVHIFDFDKSIYGHQLKVDIIKQIRQEQKFDNLEKLTQQLKKDREVARNILNHLEND